MVSCPICITEVTSANTYVCNTCAYVTCQLCMITSMLNTQTGHCPNCTNNFDLGDFLLNVKTVSKEAMKLIESHFGRLRVMYEIGNIPQYNMVIDESNSHKFDMVIRRIRISIAKVKTINKLTMTISKEEMNVVNNVEKMLPPKEFLHNNHITYAQFLDIYTAYLNISKHLRIVKFGRNYITDMLNAIVLITTPLKALGGMKLVDMTPRKVLLLGSTVFEDDEHDEKEGMNAKNEIDEVIRRYELEHGVKFIEPAMAEPKTEAANTSLHKSLVFSFSDDAKERLDIARKAGIDCVICPNSKCESIISRTEGCSQMWCTQCHTKFDYISGKIITGFFHNPEYFRYLQNNKPKEAIVSVSVSRVLVAIDEIFLYTLEKYLESYTPVPCLITMNWNEFSEHSTKFAKRSIAISIFNGYVENDRLFIHTPNLTVGAFVDKLKQTFEKFVTAWRLYRPINVKKIYTILINKLQQKYDQNMRLKDIHIDNLEFKRFIYTCSETDNIPSCQSTPQTPELQTDIGPIPWTPETVHVQRNTVVKNESEEETKEESTFEHSRSVYIPPVKFSLLYILVCYDLLEKPKIEYMKAFIERRMNNMTINTKNLASVAANNHVEKKGLLYFDNTTIEQAFAYITTFKITLVIYEENGTSINLVGVLQETSKQTLKPIILLLLKPDYTSQRHWALITDFAGFCAACYKKKLTMTSACDGTICWLCLKCKCLLYRKGETDDLSKTNPIIGAANKMCEDHNRHR